MTARYLLDTDICVYAVSARHPEVTEKLDRKMPGQVLISVITLGELLLGANKSQRPLDARRRVEALLSVTSLAGLPVEAAEQYGEIRTGLEQVGKPIGQNDLWIAAHAKAEGLILVTNNEREFRRVKGLKVENWSA